MSSQERASAGFWLQGRGLPAVVQLTAFLEELGAQHGREPSKHVTDDAYWLLKATAEYVSNHIYPSR